jgi:hypothetical protein
MRLTLSLLLAALSLPALAHAQEFSPADLEFFEAKVRPVLVERCYKCHSASEKVKGELHLDSRAGVMRGGERGPVIEPGDPGKSRLIDAIHYGNPDLQMPPKGKLSDDQIAALEQWVKLGAPWPKEPEPGVGGGAEKAAFDLQKRKSSHWAWQPVRVTPPPAVKDAAWVADPIDQFVLAKLEEKGLAPAARAEKRALIRRAYFDLVGLPPAPEAVEAFVADASPDAFAKVVDGLLASPHYGERWGRHWLDLVRYAETYGHEFDYPIPHASKYLYYVVRAFNANVPYDRFAMEHIAGDLLPEPRLHPTEGYDESPIGTGFWYFHEQTHAPVDVRQHQADRVDNQVDVFGKTFQGLTIACARCHDHKFDAISTKDYYALYGVLASTRQQQAFLDPGGKLAAVVAQLQQARRAGDAVAATQRVARDPRETPQYPPTATRFEGFDDPDFTGWFPTGFAFGTGPTGDAQWDSARRDVPRLVRPGVAHSGLLAGKLRGTLRSRSFVIDKPYVDYLLAGNGGRIRLLVDGYTMDEFSPLLFEGLTFDVKTEGGRFQWHRSDVSRYLGRRGHVELIDEGDGFVAVDEIVFTDGSGGLASPPAEQPVFEELAASPELKAAGAKLDELAASLPEPVRILAAHDGEGVDEHVFRRGSYKSLGDAVPRKFLEAIGDNDAPLAAPGGGSGRLELARRVASPDNPLTARVMANRVWHHLFGRGIVPTVDDFGVMGQPPSHPELLDHLADRFVKEGWSVKRLIRGVVLSNTYRMSSAASEHATRVDPQNVLLHHMPVRRLEGEAVRDAILAVSGRLDRTPYAPIVEVHLTEFMEGRGRPGDGGPLDGAGRRSIYTKVRRNFLPPMMLAFDMPIPFNTIGRRSVSNVPAQALILMNDPFVVEQAQVWAQRVLKEPGLTPARRIDRMYREAFGRPPTEQETADASAFLAAQAAQLGVPPEDVRAWTDLAHVLFNVKEFVFVN